MDQFRQVANELMVPVKQVVSKDDQKVLDETENKLVMALQKQYVQGWNNALEEVYKFTNTGLGGHK